MSWEKYSQATKPKFSTPKQSIPQFGPIKPPHQDPASNFQTSIKTQADSYANSKFPNPQSTSNQGRSRSRGPPPGTAKKSQRITLTSTKPPSLNQQSEKELQGHLQSTGNTKNPPSHNGDRDSPSVESISDQQPTSPAIQPEQEQALISTGSKGSAQVLNPEKVDPTRSLRTSMNGYSVRTGLVNIGDSDMLNATLNALYAVNPFRDFFKERLGARSKLVAGLASFCEKYQKIPISSDEMKQLDAETRKWQHYSNRCASQFLNKLLSKLDRKVLKNASEAEPRTSDLSSKHPVTEMFTVQLEQIEICSSCNKLNRKLLANSLTLQVPVPIFYTELKKLGDETIFFQKNKFFSQVLPALYSNLPGSSISTYVNNVYIAAQNSHSTMIATHNTTSVNICIAALLQVSMSDYHSCPICKRDTFHVQQTVLQRLGPVLVIHLDREKETYMNVTLPKALKMRDYMSEAGEYSLCAIVYRVKTERGYHYSTAIQLENNWFHVDDERMAMIEDEPQIENSYIAFYQRDPSPQAQIPIRSEEILSIYGLANLGRTDFLNATLNAVYSLRAFRSFFESVHYSYSELIQSLTFFCRNYPNEPTPEASLKAILGEVPEFNDGQPHSPREFFLRLLLTLDKKLSDPLLPRLSFRSNADKNKRITMRSLFSVSIEIVLTCCNCFHVQRVSESSQSVDLPVPTKYSKTGSGVLLFENEEFTDPDVIQQYACIEGNELKAYFNYLKGDEKLQTREAYFSSDLKVCLLYFLRASQGREGNELHCDRCRKETRHWKQSFFRHIGDVLVIHAKQFERRVRRSPVGFSKCLDLNPFSGIGFGKFNLRGIIYQTETQSEPKYTAAIDVNEIWYLFEDKKVSKIEDALTEENAYLLFYEREIESDDIKTRRVFREKAGEKISKLFSLMTKRVFQCQFDTFRQIKVSPKKYPPPQYGLRNLGNTCFLNASLHALCSLNSFRSFFAQTTNFSSSALAETLVYFCNQYQQIVIPIDLLRNFGVEMPEFGDGHQHCANSFISKMLTMIDKQLPINSHSEENVLSKYRKEKCEPLHDIFSGLMEHLFICSKCYRGWSSFSYFRTLDVPIPSIEFSNRQDIVVFSNDNIFPSSIASMYANPSDLENYLKLFRSKIPFRPQSASVWRILYHTELDSCLKYLLRASLMTADNTMECQHCFRETQHWKQSFFRYFGEVIVIHFQRFNERTGRKLLIPVSFPSELDLNPYCQNATDRYQLYAVVYHSGDLNFGHYTARTKLGGNWYFFNDNSKPVLETKEPESENAYLLFYEKKRAQ